MPVSTRRAGSVDPVAPNEGGTSGGPSQISLDQATRLIELERAQIGHEIHDGLLPLIFAASASVSGLVDEPLGQRADPTQQKLKQIAIWLEDALQTGRRLLTEVYPPELTDTLWTHAATDAVNRLFGDTKTKIHWQIDPQVNETTAPIALAAYRIVVEAVRNAIRHGQATDVVIAAEKSAGQMRITIRDDGCGFDPSSVGQDRFGIRSMMARAQLVGGVVKIDSTAGGPTIVALTVGQG